MTLKKQESRLFVDEQTKTHRSQSIGEILSERLGKVEKHEVYFSFKEVLNMYPNGYSVHILQRNSRKHVEVRVYKGIGEVTSDFFKGRENRKVRGDAALAFTKTIEQLTGE